MITKVEIYAYRTRGHVVYMSDIVELAIDGHVNPREVLDAVSKALDEAQQRYNLAREKRRHDRQTGTTGE